ncbi:MAG: glycoside hydrolase family 2, partial [Bacteroidales bacterium]|nr:glycoside hydrolase family 2 [Bacteroidales bacterium]
RHETWAEQAKAWTDYLARSCYMLSRGRFVADVLWFYGEDSNATAVYSRCLPDVPDGYNYDYANPEVLYDMVRVEGSRLVTDTGMDYKVLVIDPSIARMSFKMLSRIAELAGQGAVVCGSIPEKCASLTDDQERFDALRREVLAMPNVHSGQSCAKVLAEACAPDFIHDPAHEMLHVHRTLPDKEIYWVKNLSYDRFSSEVSFRTSGRTPLVWHPEDASVTPVSFRIENGRTVVSLDFESDDAFFVVFEGSAVMAERKVRPRKRETVLEVSSPWTVSFQEGRGAPKSVTMDKLASFTEHPDKGVKYFSGTASYSTTVRLPRTGGRVLLDLGEVKNMAQVSVNGTECGTVWKEPFVVDVTKAVRKGENTLEIRVTNLWVNRIIGDCQDGEEHPLTYTPMAFYKADDPLLPSGLLGPVVFKRER